MNGQIKDGSAGKLLREIGNKLKLELTSEQFMDIVDEIVVPSLQHQFDEGVEYTKQKIQYSLQNIK